MASISTPIFPSSGRSSDHKIPYATPKLNHRSINSSTRFSHSLPRVFDSSTICRCQKNTDNGNNRDEESPRRWDSVFQENVRNVIKWFDGYMAGYRNNQIENVNENKDDYEYDSGIVKIDGNGDGDWDWERWKKHFAEVDEHEQIVSILESQLKSAIIKEDYEDAAKIKVAIAAAATNDTVGRVMSQLNKAIKEERYKDAAFVRDIASAGLVGWWAGFSDDKKDPYGRIIRITAEHGRYLARSYSPRQLVKAADGSPLFELFITTNEKGEYKYQAVYLKQNETTQDFPITSIKSSSFITSVGPISEKDDLFANDNEDTDDGFENNLRDMIPGANDVKINVMNLTSPGKIDNDLISKIVEQIMEDEDEDEDESDDEDDDTEKINNENDEENDDIDIGIDIDIDNGSTIIGDGGQIVVKVIVDDLSQKASNQTSKKDLIRVPAKLEKKTRSLFTFSIENTNQIVSSSPNKKDAKILHNRVIDSVMLDLAKSIGKGKISMKVLKDVDQLLNLSLNQAQNRQALSGSTTFNRIELPSTRNPLNGLYIGAHGIYTSEVINLKRKFGQWQEDGNINLEFYEYVEAVKITGDHYVPAGQVAFRAKVGTKYQLPHRGIIPEEFGVIGRYRGQGRIADPGFENPRWVEGELVILDGKYVNGGIVVGFVYWAPESQFLVFFNQLRLQE